jgi:hypothetical protein
LEAKAAQQLQAAQQLLQEQKAALQMSQGKLAALQWVQEQQATGRELQERQAAQQRRQEQQVMQRKQRCSGRRSVQGRCNRWFKLPRPRPKQASAASVQQQQFTAPVPRPKQLSRKESKQQRRLVRRQHRKEHRLVVQSQRGEQLMAVRPTVALVDHWSISEQFEQWQQGRRMAQVDEASIRAQIKDSRKCQQIAQRWVNRLQRILDNAKRKEISVAEELAGEAWRAQHANRVRRMLRANKKAEGAARARRQGQLLQAVRSVVFFQAVGNWHTNMQSAQHQQWLSAVVGAVSSGALRLLGVGRAAIGSHSQSEKK